MVVRSPGKIAFLSVVAVFLVACAVSMLAGAAEDSVIPREAVSKRLLGNGLVVLSKEVPGSGLVSIDLKIRAGSSLEGDKAASGLSHLVEHMVFKGTPTRPSGQIEREVKSYGGIINGSVSQDVVSFHMTVSADRLNDSLALLKDMLTNAVFDAGEIEKEREVILKEIRLRNDDPDSRLVRLLNETAYIRHPYRYPAIGYEEALRRLTRDDLVRFYERMYVPNRMVLAIVGSVGAEDAAAAVEKELSGMRASDYGGVPFREPEPSQISKRTAEEGRAITLSYLAVAFQSTSLFSEDLFAMDVLAMLLGRGDNSRLNATLRKEAGIVHSISAWNYTPEDPGLFVITAVLDSGKLDAAQDAIAFQIERVKLDVSDEELGTAKKMVVADYIFSLEGTDEQADQLASNFILAGDEDFSRRYVEGVQKVTKDDVKRAASLYLSNDKATVVALLPADALASRQVVPPQPAPEEMIKKKVLPNGLTLLVRRDHRTPAVSITVAMLGGLAYEDERSNGISNLTARMLLKGAGGRGEADIKGAIEKLGGRIDTFSGFNSMGLNAELLKNDLGKVLEIIRDVVLTPDFPEAELDKEKVLTLAMIKEREDDIFNSGFDILRADLFPLSSFGMKTLGSSDSVSPMTRDQLIGFYRGRLTPGSMVVSISGDVEEAGTFEMLEKLFGVAEGPVASASRPHTPGPPVRSKEFESEKEESLLLTGFRTVGVKDPDRFILETLGSIMSGTSGRLFTKLRDKLPLAYTLGCSQTMTPDFGYLAFYVATTRDKIDEAASALEAEIDEIKKDTVTEEELESAKRELISAHRLSRQSNSFYSYNSALDELYGLGYDNLYRHDDGVSKVTKADIARVAAKYLNSDGSSTVTLISKDQP